MVASTGALIRWLPPTQGESSLILPAASRRTPKMMKIMKLRKNCLLWSIHFTGRIFEIIA